MKCANDDDHPCKYYYHLSDEMKRDFTFTSALVDHVLNTNNISALTVLPNINAIFHYL